MNKPGHVTPRRKLWGWEAQEGPVRDVACCVVERSRKSQQRRVLRLKPLWAGVVSKPRAQNL